MRNLFVSPVTEAVEGPVVPANLSTIGIPAYADTMAEISTVAATVARHMMYDRLSGPGEGVAVSWVIPIDLWSMWACRD